MEYVKCNKQMSNDLIDITKKYLDDVEIFCDKYKVDFNDVLLKIGTSFFSGLLEVGLLESSGINETEGNN